MTHSLSLVSGITATLSLVSGITVNLSLSLSADELVSGIRRKNDLLEQRTNGSVEKVARLAL